jgi:hypothetical protein
MKVVPTRLPSYARAKNANNAERCAEFLRYGAVILDRIIEIYMIGVSVEWGWIFGVWGLDVLIEGIFAVVMYLTGN